MTTGDSEGLREERLLDLLREGAEVRPSPDVDRAVRAMLVGPGPRRLIRPELAVGLGLASCLALGAGLSTVFAAAGAAEYGPVVATVAVFAYLAASAAASLPLLLMGRWRRAAVAGGTVR